MSQSAGLTHRTTIPNQEIAMLLHEALARARMREDQQYARQARLARRLASARRWRRIAGYAGRRAARAAAGL
ncbi:MAG: hypothetical protein ACR2FQ_09620 [Pseudonocardiaceae bacterium]